MGGSDPPCMQQLQASEEHSLVEFISKLKLIQERYRGLSATKPLKPAAAGGYFLGSQQEVHIRSLKESLGGRIPAGLLQEIRRAVSSLGFKMGIQWSKVTGLKVFVTQAQYEAGQHVSGEVFANVLSEIEFSKLTLEISGAEALHYKRPLRNQEHEEGGAAKSVEAKEGKELFHSRAVLFEAPDGRLQPGRYRYDAKVKYFLRAEFENCFIRVKDLHAVPEALAATAAATAPAPVASSKADEATVSNGEGSLPQGEGTPRYPLKLMDVSELFIVESDRAKVPPHLVEQSVNASRCLPCLKPYVVVAAVWLENTLLCDGDTFRVNVEVENPSNYTLSDVVLAVWRVTTLRAPGLRPYVVRNRMLYQQVASIPPCSCHRAEEALQAEIPIPEGLQQTISGGLFDVQYEVTLTSDFKKGSINIRDALVIRKRAVLQQEHLKQIKAPPGWEYVDLTTDIIRIQLEGAGQPDIGNYEGIGYVKVPVKTGPA